jgi:hypothetical protein
LFFLLPDSRSIMFARRVLSLDLERMQCQDEWDDINRLAHALATTSTNAGFPEDPELAAVSQKR